MLAPRTASSHRETPMILLAILLALLVIGSLPAWPYSRQWGYYPSTGIGIILLILILLLADHVV
jgi:low affinity Fe/Cu permease